MLSFLREHGYRIVADPAKAEVIIVNTCGFIQSAKEEAIATLFEMAGYKQAGRCRLLVATGCFAQRYPEAIREEMPEVDVILGVNEYGKLDEAIREADRGARPVYTDDDGSFFEYGRVLTTPKYSAYIRIGEGCDNRCSYCAIPMIRGPYRSRPKEDILREVRELAARGVREFTLISQDTTRYGTDKGGKSGLPQLLREIAAIDGVSWLRTLYCYPERVTDELIDTVAELPNVCKYLDLPMQHVSEGILRDMNRAGTGARIRQVARKLHERGIALRTTLMVGFPGETDADFDELMDFVADMRFERMGAFMFSPEEGTPAAEMPGQVSEEVKQARYDALMTLQHGISLSRNRERVGTACRVLVERRRGARYVGRSELEAPETDGSIFFSSETPCEAGEFVTVRITGARAYDLMGVRE